MKYSLLSIIFMAWLMACNQRPPQDHHRGDSSLNSAEQSPEGPKDSLFLKIAGNAGKLEVSAAGAAGVIRLKDPSANLQQILGKADSTAVDMCKDLSFWYSGGNASLAVYSLCDNDLDMRKSIQMIRLSGYSFTTAKGISRESSYEAISGSYPGIRPLGKIVSADRTVFIAGDVQEGIAFELSDTTASGQCLAVLVYLPGKGVTSTSIPLYPGLEKF